MMLLKWRKIGGLLRLALLGALLLSVSAVPTRAVAHKGATGIVKMRMDAMRDLKNQLKRIDAMLAGKNYLSRKRLMVILSKVEQHAGPGMLKLFPQNSHQKPSEAAPAIWTSWQEFEVMAMELKALSSGFRQSITAKTPKDTLKTGYLKLRASCKSCHERFRQ